MLKKSIRDPPKLLLLHGNSVQFGRKKPIALFLSCALSRKKRIFALLYRQRRGLKTLKSPFYFDKNVEIAPEFFVVAFGSKAEIVFFNW